MDEAPPARDLLDRWRSDLEAWAIPDHIIASVSESPWVLPRQVFARRADRVSLAPAGPSYDRAFAALDPPGTVLDVGSGAGAASLPLLPRCTGLAAVDTDRDAGPARRAGRRGRCPGAAGARQLARIRRRGRRGRRGDVPSRDLQRPADRAVPGRTDDRGAPPRRCRDDGDAPAGQPQRSLAQVPRPAAADRADGRRPAGDPGRAWRRGPPRTVAATERRRLRELRRDDRRDQKAAV